jgi:hypothetical protein
LVVVLTVGCGGDDSSTPAPTINVTGTWAGEWRSDQGTRGTLSLSLVDNAGSVSGSISLPESLCLQQASLSGSVAGNTLSFTASSASDSMTFSASVESTEHEQWGQLGTVHSGTYSVVGGACQGDTGTFVAFELVCISEGNCALPD